MSEQKTSDHKIGGCCTICDEPCFKVMAVFPPGDSRAGEPKRLGPPLEGAARISFILLDGSRADLTFCAACAETVGVTQYSNIWRKCLRSWERELKGERPEWYIKQFDNGILAELSRISWQDFIKANQHG